LNINHLSKGEKKAVVIMILREESIKKTGLENCIHGDAKRNNRAKLYKIWIGMKSRCYNPSRWDYKYYGKKGIIVCNEWRDDYNDFKLWAILTGYQEGLSIDRINSSGNYEPKNCQWITHSENLSKSNSENPRKKPKGSSD